MSSSKDEAGESSSPQENVVLDHVSLTDLEKAVGGLHLETPVHNTDDHLIEFSEALRTVAKALRRAAEGKVSAQAEAAEWKRKYELERARNQQLELIEDSCRRQNGIITSRETREISGGQAMVGSESNGQPERCCAGDGICSHEVLFDSEAGSGTGDSLNRMKRKLWIKRNKVSPELYLGFQLSGSFRVEWICASENHSLLVQASFKLSWRCKGERGNQYKHDIVSFEKGNISTAGRTNKQISLKWESPPQTVLIFTKPNSTSVRILCLEMVRWLKEQKNINVYVEPRVKLELLNDSSFFSFVNTWQDESEISRLHTKVDLVMTLGGDGTVLWAASMFKGPVPPIVPFSLGSLGFMTPFYSEHYREWLDSVLKGPISITLRHRLQCHVIRDSARNEYETEGPILVLNEVTIDRGISSYLTNLECYCDNSFVTSVQGDGLILSTTSGSTAYSLAAGGSMVHPQVPGILFTPICPHSLSFRPLILPEHVTLRIQVPFNSRNPAWASFDGKDRKQLAAGDALVCSMAPWPVPTACLNDSTADFLRSIQDGLHWNLRKTQSFDGPREQL